jgi:hypothetical protein
VNQTQTQTVTVEFRTRYSPIVIAESATVLLEDSRLCAIKRKIVLYLLCVISAIVQINSLVKSGESTIIFATCHKHVTIYILSYSRYVTLNERKNPIINSLKYLGGIFDKKDT